MMTFTTSDCLADLYLTLSWEKDGIRHEDTFFADEANLYRDYFPLGIGERILFKEPGERISFAFKPGELVPAYSEKEIHPVHRRFVDTSRLPQNAKKIRKGRFYPKGILKGLSGIFRENMTPFQVKNVDEEWVVADFNHPLSKQKLTLDIEVVDVRDKQKERGGLSNDWIDMLVSGPGIQARSNGIAVDFFSGTPFAREDDLTDRTFYKAPRLVSHIDEKARENLSTLYGMYLKPGSRVLDLMSSWQSHLPDGLNLTRLAGLGMNERELEANPRLDDRVVHDLNENPSIPFDDSSFDAVICSLSVEYLTRPFEVFQEIARVLSPGGQCLITFSNRWFPTKTIRIWPELHEFERLGLVTEYLLSTNAFTRLKTRSLRGYPRPYTDSYFPELRNSDPLYFVCGIRGNIP